ncbi:MAG: CapA family protein [Clostridia bacterium]|nr:CapA family protein [Clostridia bacterium]
MRSDKRNSGRFSKIILILAIIAVVTVGAINIAPLLFGEPAISPDDRAAEQAKEEPEVPVDLSIVCAGDVMAHLTQVNSQYDSSIGDYNFDNNFQFVKKYIEPADLAICNIETTFGGEPYAGYPAFSAPDALARSVAAAGFDVASTANNHMLDRGTAGLYRTIQVLQANNLKTTGSIENPGDRRYALTEVKGIRIAVIGYTYENSPNETDVSINGNVISKDTASHINSFNYKKLDAELAKISDVVSAAKDEGAQIVIMFYHWGEEYQTAPNEWQRYIAEQTAKTMPVDIIFASHPHVLQSMEWIEDETTGKRVPVYYSLGNFISNQRNETLGNRRTEEGAIAMVNLSIMKSTGEITKIDMGVQPTWVERYGPKGAYKYGIIPLDSEMAGNPYLQASGHLSRAQTALEEANGILGVN